MEERKKESPIQVTDRRFWVQDKAAIDNASIPARRYPTLVEELKMRTELAEQKLKEKVAKLDEENEAFRLRLTKDLERRLASEKLE
ncbi:MAG: hypothetical protein V3T55_07690, partial [Anaerolineales bacterium]